MPGREGAVGVVRARGPPASPRALSLARALRADTAGGVHGVVQVEGGSDEEEEEGDDDDDRCRRRGTFKLLYIYSFSSSVSFITHEEEEEDDDRCRRRGTFKLSMRV